jgi:hypothetical protein
MFMVALAGAAGSAEFDLRRGVQPEFFDPPTASYATSVTAQLHMGKRLVNAIHFRDVPAKEASEKIRASLVRSAVQPFRVMLYVRLFLSQMAQGHGNLLTAFSEVIDMTGRPWIHQALLSSNLLAKASCMPAAPPPTQPEKLTAVARDHPASRKAITLPPGGYRSRGASYS